MKDMLDHKVMICCLLIAAMYPFGKMVDWAKGGQLEICVERSARWEKAAKEQAETVKMYDSAMSKCSYVVGQHISLLNSFRKELVENRKDELIPFEQKYSFIIGTLEKGTPELSKLARWARTLKSKYRLPIFLY